MTAVLALNCQNVIKSFAGARAVNDVSLTIHKGQCFGLLGPNGAGKTTLMRLVLGLVRPDQGEMTLLGYPVPEKAQLARHLIGVVPQFDNLDPDFTVYDNLLVYGRYFSLPDRVLKKRIPELLTFADLWHKAKAKMNELSGGMKRRLTLARALVNDPEMIVLDEPTTGLDPQARHQMWAKLRALLLSGKTLFLTTHFMDEAERLCDFLAIMDHGQIIAEDSPQQLIHRFIEPFVVEVYGENVERWQNQFAQKLCRHYERVGETLFCYSDDPRAILATLENTPGLRFLSRPANLEDVFLRLTGRDLRE